MQFCAVKLGFLLKISKNTSQNTGFGIVTIYYTIMKNELQRRNVVEI